MAGRLTVLFSLFAPANRIVLELSVLPIHSKKRCCARPIAVSWRPSNSNHPNNPLLRYCSAHAPAYKTQVGLRQRGANESSPSHREHIVQNEGGDPEQLKRAALDLMAKDVRTGAS
jgi:hypothetical protein